MSKEIFKNQIMLIMKFIHELNQYLHLFEI